LFLQVETGLPVGWEVRHSISKILPYYFCPDTKESRWEPPHGTDPEKLKVFMADYHSAKGIHPDASAGRGGQHANEGKIRCAHLLIKHEGSRRPSSWREAKITRSKNDAMATIKDYEAKIRAGETSLGDIAVTESDCSSARKRGDL
jgi:peptidyl-prolyl cis-trans isomerase NIMA-interacting 1